MTSLTPKKCLSFIRPFVLLTIGHFGPNFCPNHTLGTPMKNIYACALIALVFSNIAIAKNPDKMIYGEDNRYEMRDFRAHKFIEQSKSIAGRVSTEVLWSIDNKTFHYEYMSLDGIGISGGNFSRQSLLPDCTGFLVSEDILVTAGHCMMSQEECDKNVWVFDFVEEKTSKRILKQEQIFKCKEIIKQELESTEEGKYIDYAIIKLDRSTQRKGLKFRTTGTIAKDEPVVMIGHPMGLPMKFTADAYVFNSTDKWTLQANLDAFQGNSGSPVFNETTGEVEGILVRGSEDFVEDEQGVPHYNICPEQSPLPECNYGEDILKIEHVGLQNYL